MRALFLLVLVVAAPAGAQFSELAATDDGRQLYFSSTLVLGDAAAARPESRIYLLDAAGIRLFAQRSAQQVPTNSWGSGDGVGMAQVSGTGGTVGFTARGVCPDQPCMSPVPAQGEVRGSQELHLGPGTLQLSRNGRWALLTPVLVPSGQAPATLLNLDTGERATVGQPVTDSFGVASDGTVLVRASGFGLWRQGQFTPISIAGAFRPLALSDNAAVLIYTQLGAPGQVTLQARNLGTGLDTTLFTPQRSMQLPWLMGLSNDGRWVLYRVTENRIEGPAFLADTSTGESQPVPLDPGELAAAGTLSGLANLAFLVTTAGRIVQVDLAAGVRGRLQTVVPATAYVSQHNQFSPGSLVRLQGSLPGSLDQLTGRLLLDGQPLPVLFVTAGTAAVQIPWEQRVGEFAFHPDLAGDSPFHQNELTTVWPMAPMFEQADPGQSSLFGIKLIKGDFSGLVTTTPAPGDVVNAYMTGLGAVPGHPDTGTVTPVGSVLPIQSDFHCRFLPQATEAETLFAGLAPGMIGIYQVSFRMPADAGSTPLNGMECRYGGGGFWFIGVGGTAPPAP